jgi:NitT/TauT family transport system substrate-binding protein
LAAAGLAGAATLAGARRTLAEEAPPETTSVRLGKGPATCLAPLDILDDVLREEGFADVRYVLDTGDYPIVRGDLDFAQDPAAHSIIPLDAGKPFVILAGVHPGCYELFARESVRSVVDLKGKNVGVSWVGNGDHLLLSVIAASVGLDPPKTSIGSPSDRAIQRTISPTTRSMRS